MQIIVKDKNDFDIVSHHPGVQYSSSITGVIDIEISVDDPLYVKVKKYSEMLEKQSETPKDKDKSNKWEATWMNGIYIISQNTNLAEYLNSYVKDGYIKVPKEYWWKFYLLLKSGFIEPTQDFINMFKPMTEKSKINECRTFTSKVNFRNVKWSFNEYYAKAGLTKPDISIGNCKFLHENYHIRNLKIIKGYCVDIAPDAKKIQFKDSETNNVIILEMKGWQRFRRPNYPENKEIMIASASSGVNIINPFVVPEFLGINTSAELNAFENSFGYISNRRMPVELTNRLKAEVMIRLHLGKMQQKE